MQCTTCHKRNATRVCGVCSVLAYCGEQCAEDDWLRHNVEHLGPGEHTADMVLPNLWLGSIEALLDPKIMGRVSAVVSAVTRDRLPDDMLACFLNGRASLRVPIYDTKDEPIELYFESAAAFIHVHLSNGKGVLIHCHAGVSRSVTLLVYYMMRHRGYRTPEEALEKIREVRPYVRPNSGFLRKLKRDNLIF